MECSYNFFRHEVVTRPPYYSDARDEWIESGCPYARTNYFWWGIVLLNYNNERRENESAFSHGPRVAIFLCFSAWAIAGKVTAVPVWSENVRTRLWDGGIILFVSPSISGRVHMVDRFTPSRVFWCLMSGKGCGWRGWRGWIFRPIDTRFGRWLRNSSQ